NEGDVLGVLDVAVIGGMVRELHGEAEPAVVLRAHLPQLLELLDARNALERRLGIAQERLLLQRPFRVLQRDDDSVADHPPGPSKATASLAAIAATLTIPRLVVEGARMCAGARVPISIGPTASPLLTSLSSVLYRLALSRFGKSSRFASPLSSASG